VQCCEHNKQTVVKQLSRSVEVLSQAVSPRESCSLIDLSVNRFLFSLDVIRHIDTTVDRRCCISLGKQSLYIKGTLHV